MLKCITNNILNEKNDEINGISISPKKEFNIIKIWFKDYQFDYQKHFIEEKESLLSLKNSIFKKHDI